MPPLPTQEVVYSASLYVSPPTSSTSDHILSKVLAGLSINYHPYGIVINDFFFGSFAATCV
jgi:hypothetical protein